MRVSLEGAVRNRLALEGSAAEGREAYRQAQQRIGGKHSRSDCQDQQRLLQEIEPLVVLAEQARAYLKSVDKELAVFAKSHLVCSRLMGVFGVGPICAISFFSAIEDPWRFSRSEQIGAYFGLIPRRHESGMRSRTLGITKTGNKLTRLHLVNSATVLLSRGPDCELKDWGLRLSARLGAQKARVALARKLAVILLTIWKKGVPYQSYPRTGPA
jgi:transposase